MGDRSCGSVLQNGKKSTIWRSPGLATAHLRQAISSRGLRFGNSTTGHVTGPVALNFACLFVPFQGLMQVLNVYCNCWTRTLISHVDSVQRDHSTIKRAVPPPPPPPSAQPGNMAQLAVTSSVSTHCVSSTVTIPFQWQYTMGVVGSLEMF